MWGYIRRRLLFGGFLGVSSFGPDAAGGDGQLDIEGELDGVGLSLLIEAVEDGSGLFL